MNNIIMLFDKIEMDETRSDEILSKLTQNKRAKNLWLIPVSAIAAALIIVMVIPYTRNTVVNAAENLFSHFKITTGNNEEFGWGTDPETGNKYSAIAIHGKGENYAKVKDGRLYFVLGDEWTDVTDYCSETTYYRHEIIHEDGVKEVIIVGGKVGVNTFGWIEIVYDAEGNYAGSFAQLPSSEPRGYKMSCADDFRWVDIAYKNEGCFPDRKDLE